MVPVPTGVSRSLQCRHPGKVVVFVLFTALVLAFRHSVIIYHGDFGQLYWFARPLPAHGRVSNRPHVYLLANNAAASTKWQQIEVGKDDILVGTGWSEEAGIPHPCCFEIAWWRLPTAAALPPTLCPQVMFNTAVPIPYFEAVPMEQKLLMQRGLNNTFIHAEAQISNFSQSFDRIVFIETNFTNYLEVGSGRKNMRAVGHYVVLERYSRFMQEQIYALYPAYDRKTGKRKIWPSTGFIAVKYCQHYFPLYALVLVGFSGEGLPAHDFEFEEKYYNETSVQRL
jgi:hypothetical protein